MNSKMIAPTQPMETLLSKCQIPIIDMAHIGTDTCPMKSVVRRVGTQLHKALSEKGLALLVNHGICDDKLKAAYSCLDDFCGLPEEVQSRFLRRPSTNHGYIKPGMERFDGKTMEYRHAFNITTLKESELPEPDIIPEFRYKVGNLASDFTKLSSVLLKALALALELPPEYFTERHSCMMSGKNENQTTMRLIYYPPVPPEDDASRHGTQHDQNTFTRCGAHCDYGTFTLLAQDCEGGLEVKLPCSGTWQPVGHLPGALLVNTGEMLAAWTQDKFPALNHRVIIPKTQYARARGRHSVAFFCHPDDRANLDPIPQQAEEQTLANGANATCKEHHHRSNSLHNRMVNAYHHIQKRFRETYV